MIYLYRSGCFNLNEEDIFHMKFSTDKITLGTVMIILTTDAQKHCRIFLFYRNIYCIMPIIDTRINYNHEKINLDANGEKKFNCLEKLKY